LNFCYNARTGCSGSNKGRHGKGGESLVITVPLGTVIKEFDPKKKKEGATIVDLDHEGSSYVIARGGRGGRGNKQFATGASRSPTVKETGQPGEEKTVLMEVKTIADVGLVVGPSCIPFLTSLGIPKRWKVNSFGSSIQCTSQNCFLPIYNSESLCWYDTVQRCGNG
jgi:hypothetical protein